MILLASGDFAGQKEILNKIVAYRCIVFLRNVTPSSATVAASIPLKMLTYFTGGGVFRVGFQRWRHSCSRACGSVSG